MKKFFYIILAICLLLPNIALANNKAISAANDLFCYDFTNGALPSGVTVTRATKGTYFNSSGVLSYASANGERLNYNPITHASRGILIEPSRTNLLIQSNLAASWTTTHASLGTAGISPDGTSNAAFVIPAADSNNHNIYFNKPTISNVKGYVLSFYVKAGGYNYVGINYASSAFGNGVYATFYIPTGGGGSEQTHNVWGTGVYTGSSIEYIGNDWYRISVSGYQGSSTSVYPSISPGDTAAHAIPGTTWTGNGTSGIYVFGAQFEIGETPTTLIPTTTTTITAAADQISFTNPSGTGGLRYNLDDGTIQWIRASSGSYTAPYNLAHIRRVCGVRNVEAHDLKVVAAQQCILSGQETGYTPNAASRHRYIVANDAYSLALNFSTKFLDSSGGGNGNEIVIDEVSIEKSDIESTDIGPVAVYFGGERDVTLAAGTLDHNSDEIQASSFNLSKFSAGEEYYVKTKFHLSNAAYLYPKNNCTLTQDEGSNAQYWFYDSASTTVSGVDTAGKFTYSGTAPSSALSGYWPIMLGRPVNAGSPSVIALGASIVGGTGDTGYTVYGRGFIARGLRSSDNSVIIPYINMGIQSIKSATYLTVLDDYDVFFKYGKFSIDQLGGNDNVSAAATEANLETLWASFRANGISKIFRLSMMIRTSSTDSWATEANQTYATAGSVVWNPSGFGDTVDTWVQGKVTDGTIDGYIAIDSIRGTDRNKWLVNGSADYCTFDGTHPTTTCHTLAGAEVRSVVFPFAGYTP